MAETAPATLEGWYALHQVFAVDWAALRALDPDAARALRDDARALLKDVATPSHPDRTDPERAGWSGAFRIVGGGADVMFIHFRETFDELGDAALRVRRSRTGTLLRHVYDYTSVTEAGMYHATAEAAAQAAPGSKQFDALIAEQAEAERGSAHTQMRLYPQVPEGMRYVCFYPMNKRRVAPDNWYTLPVSVRNELMREHGLTGRRYARRIFQVITGSMGFDDWEWGVTLFAHDPLEFKRIVSEMRYDEASARYAEFGAFFTGIRVDPAQLAALLTPGD